MNFDESDLADSLSSLRKNIEDAARRRNSASSSGRYTAASDRSSRYRDQSQDGTHEFPLEDLDEERTPTQPFVPPLPPLKSIQPPPYSEKIPLAHCDGERDLDHKKPSPDIEDTEHRHAVSGQDKRRHETFESTPPTGLMNNSLSILQGIAFPSASFLFIVLLIIIVLGNFVIVFFYLIKGSIIDVKDFLARITGGIGAGIATAFRSKYQTRESTVPPSLPPVIRHIDHWVPALDVAATGLKQLGGTDDAMSQRNLPTKEAKQLSKFNADFQGQLAAPLGKGRDDIMWLVKGLKEDPVSIVCWGDDESKLINEGFSWLDQYLWTRWPQCRKLFVQQSQILLDTFLEAQKSRSQLIKRLDKVKSDNLNDIEQRTCKQSKELRRAHAHRAQERKTDDSSESKALDVYVSQLSRVADAVDATCRMARTDNHIVMTVRQVMDEELQFLSVSIQPIQSVIAKANKWGRRQSREMVREFEESLIEFSEKWLDITACYYLG